MAESPKKRRPKKLDENALWEYALRALAPRAHSSAELRQKLRRRAKAQRDVEKVIAKLERYGYLDDRRYAESYAATRLENQGFGEARVLRDLRKKGVPQTVAEQAVARAFENTEEAELVEAFLKRKYRQIPLPGFLAEPRNLASAYRRLRYAGFSAGSAIQVLKRYSTRAEELDGAEEEPR